jgi:hypothetical protein
VKGGANETLSKGTGHLEYAPYNKNSRLNEKNPGNTYQSRKKREPEWAGCKNPYELFTIVPIARRNKRKTVKSSYALWPSGFTK